MVALIPSEAVECGALVRALRRRGIPCQHLGAGVPTGSRQGAVQRARGAEAGWPDIVVVVEAGTCVWVEMKRRRRGRLSPAQTTVHMALLARGHTVIVAAGADDAWEQLRGLLDSIPAVSGEAFGLPTAFNRSRS